MSMDIEIQTLRDFFKPNYLMKLILALNKPMNITNLGTVANVCMSSRSKGVKRLISEGYIKCITLDGRSARETIVVLTEKGLKAQQELMKIKSG